MNQDSQGVDSNALAIVPAKRKRGRPRKYSTADAPNYHLGESSHSSRSHGVANNHVPAGFRGINGSQPRQVEPIRSIKPVGMAGQIVSGVIEGEFDGGYLLTVKVRNSNITLRGVVFKPGRCAPVTAENDVAPTVQMIHRNEVPLPSESYSRVSNPKSRSRERNGVSLPPSGNLVALTTKLASPPPPVHSVGAARGNVVPVLLQPSESEPVALHVIHPPAESAETERRVPKLEEEFTPEPMEEDDASQDQSLKGESCGAEAKSTEPTEVVRGIHTPSDSAAAAKSSVSIEDEASNKENHHQPLFIEPLQHYPINPLDTGKMTELLQAVQENAMKNQMPGA